MFYFEEIKNHIKIPHASAYRIFYRQVQVCHRTVSTGIGFTNPQHLHQSILPKGRKSTLSFYSKVTKQYRTVHVAALHIVAVLSFTYAA